MRRLALLLLLAAAPAAAGDLVVEVRTAGGKPIQNAVVMLYPARAVPAKPTGTYQVVQQDIQFDPFVLVVPVGGNVAFPNRDPVRHQVYSFSKAKTFELKLYAKDQAHVVHFDKAGIVALGCNIHDAMTAFIAVVDTGFAVKTGADGVARLRGVPEGAARLSVWHPYQRSPGGFVERQLALPAAPRPERVTLSLRTPHSAFDTY